MNDKKKCESCKHKPIHSCGIRAGSCDNNNKWEAINCENCDWQRQTRETGTDCTELRGNSTCIQNKRRDWKPIEPKPKIKKGCGNCKWNYLNKGIYGSTCKIKREEAGCYRKVCHNQTEWEAIPKKSCSTCRFSQVNNGLKDKWCSDLGHGSCFTHNEWEAIESKPKIKKECYNCNFGSHNHGGKTHCPALDTSKSCGSSRILWKAIEPKACGNCKWNWSNNGDGKTCRGAREKAGCYRKKCINNTEWEAIPPKPDKHKCLTCRFGGYDYCKLTGSAGACDDSFNKYQPIKPKIKRKCDTCKWVGKKCRDIVGLCNHTNGNKGWEAKPTIRKECTTCEYNGKCPNEGTKCLGGTVPYKYIFWKPIEKVKPEKRCDNCRFHSTHKSSICPVGFPLCDKKKNGLYKWQPIEPKPKPIKRCSTCIYNYKNTGSESCLDIIGHCNGLYNKWAENKKAYTPIIDKGTRNYIKGLNNMIKEKEVKKEMVAIKTKKERLQAEIKEVRKILDKEQKRVKDILDKFKYSNMAYYVGNNEYMVSKKFIEYLKEYQFFDRSEIKKLKKVKYIYQHTYDKEYNIKPIEDALNTMNKYAEAYELYSLQTKLCEMKRDCYQDLEKPDCPECGLEQDRKDAKFCFSCGANITSGYKFSKSKDYKF